MTPRPGVLAALALAAPLLAGEAPAAGAQVRITWERAYVLLPVAADRLVGGRMDEAFVREELAALPAGRKLPAVLYLHGCSGLAPGNFDYMHLLAGEGYAVLAPDSFARPGRPKTCDPRRHRGIPGAPFARVAAMRQEEIRYGLERMRGLAWVDAERLFLMGHSQGGAAVAAFPNPGFRGVIISGSTCQYGLNAPEGTPVLAVYSEKDPWLRNRSPRGCGEWGFVYQRPIEFHLFPGSAHNLAGDARARALIRGFLRRHAPPAR
jgi:dienelactone hydrolase